MLESTKFIVGCATLWTVSLLSLAAQAPALPSGFDELQKLARNENLEFLVFEAGGRVHYVQGAAVKLVFKLPVERGVLGHHAYPTLSPDGKYIALVRPGDPSEEIISSYSLTDGTLSDLYRLQGGHVYGLSWSPTGKQIAFIGATSRGRASVNIFGTEAGRVIEMTTAGLGVEGRISLDSPPSWSPDGERIALEIDQQAGGPYKRAVAIVDLASHKVSLLADGEKPSWSPNGNEIAYYDLKKRNVLTIRPDGSGKKKLFSPYFLLGGPTWPGGLDLPLLWLPDEQIVGYNEVVGEGPTYSFSIRNIKGGKKRRVYSDSRLVVVGWRRARQSHQQNRPQEPDHHLRVRRARPAD